MTSASSLPRTPIRTVAPVMLKNSDASSVHIKVAQYFVNKKLEELKKKKFHLKSELIDGDTRSGSHQYSWDDLPQQLQEALHPSLRKESTRVAIIGGGVAGLRTAMLLQKHDIPYEIFEASDRPGGRIFTYSFRPDPDKSLNGKHEYYDVGAMRFPNNNANKATFDLFKELGFRFRNEENPDGELIEFKFGIGDNIRHFNGISTTAKDAAAGFDLFGEGKPLGNVPRGFVDVQDTDEEGNVYRGVDACHFKAFSDLRKKLASDFDKEWKKLLEEWDWASTHSYLARAEELRFPQPVIDWIEKHKSGTGRYAQALTEEILTALIVYDPNIAKNGWWCLEGGSEVLIKEMLFKLSNPPHYNHRVTAVAEDSMCFFCGPERFARVEGQSGKQRM
ncbi:hypothetical protein AN958_03990 [Leucoagaricus sp. SymC.cos]|nr:hypothetical protein AN958_03990 [Leucoagaricus sp. SymC.cos]